MDGGSDGTSGIGVRTQDSLVKLVGYAEIEKASGVSRSTIERAWRRKSKDGKPLPDDGEPRLPKPGKIGTRSVWALSDVNDWLLARARWQSGIVATMARVSVDDLEPEQLEDQARDLAAQALSKRTGEKVDPTNLSLQLTQRITEDEFKAAQVQEFEIYSERFADIGLERAMYLAGWIFAPLRTVFAKMLPGGPEAKLFRDPDQLAAFGAAALYDDTSEELGKAARAAKSDG